MVWINGAFSSGKTTVAKPVVEQLRGSFLLDPEVIGAVLSDHLVPARLYAGDYQGLPLWRTFTRDAVLAAAIGCDGPVVVPMTLARTDYFQEVVGAINARVPLWHYTLMASRETVLRREESRVDDTGAWSAKTIDRVLPELSSSRYEEHLDAENRSADQIAADIVSRLPK